MSPCYMIMAPLMQMDLSARTDKTSPQDTLLLYNRYTSQHLNPGEETNYEHIQLLSSNTVISGLLRQHITTLHLQEIINVEG